MRLSFLICHELEIVFRFPMWESRFVIWSLFYLLGMLSVDLVIDASGDVTVQRGYYCTLLSSFASLTGLARLLPACVLLALSTLLAFYRSRGLPRKLHALTISILALIGLPLFLNTAKLVNSACPTLLFPTNAVRNYHSAILAVLVSTLAIQILVHCYLSSPKSRTA